jgi:hypothetical protein
MRKPMAGMIRQAVAAMAMAVALQAASVSADH